jgi:hypothetical protein
MCRNCSSKSHPSYAEKASGGEDPASFSNRSMGSEPAQTSSPQRGQQKLCMSLDGIAGTSWRQSLHHMAYSTLNGQSRAIGSSL